LICVHLPLKKHPETNVRQVLFRIPIQGNWSLGPLGDVPGFGFGIVLLAWCLFGAFSLWRILKSEGGFTSEVKVATDLRLRSDAGCRHRRLRLGGGEASPSR
jgi:hypothetical protein